MKKSAHRIVPALTALLGALLGFALRCWQLTKGADITGRLRTGHPSGIVLAVFCAAAAAALALLSRRLEPKKGYTESFSSGKVEFIVSLAAAALLVFSSVLSLMNEHTGIPLLLGALGLLAGLCIAVTAVQRFQGIVPSLAIHVVPCVFLAARLIVVFKQWSVDPVIQDYCYNLFASITSMCAVYQLGGFCLDTGRRRLSTFWCLSGVVFSAVALTSPGTGQRAFYAAMLIWCAVNGWQLLED